MRRTWSSSSNYEKSSMGAVYAGPGSKPGIKHLVAMLPPPGAPAVFDSNARLGNRAWPKVMLLSSDRQRADVDTGAAAHGGGHCDLAQINTLGRGGTSLVQGVRSEEHTSELQ